VTKLGKKESLMVPGQKTNNKFLLEARTDARVGHGPEGGAWINEFYKTRGKDGKEREWKMGK
jgi:hypothetical protein